MVNSESDRLKKGHMFTDAGKVSAEQAKLHAETEFEEYRIVQDKLFESDFDRLLREVEDGYYE